MKFTKELIEQWRFGVSADLKVGAIYISDAEKIIKALDEIERQQQRIAELEAERRWIPVSERLPKHDERVLTVRKKEIMVGFYTGTSHWQPLPQPPTYKDGE